MCLVVSGHAERQNLDTVKMRFLVDEQLLSVPDVVQVKLRVFWVLYTSWITTGDEVSDSAVDT